MASSLTDPNLLTMIQGTTFRVIFNMYNPGATLTPIHLSSYGATFTIYNRAGGTAVVSVTDLTTIDPITNLPFPSGDAPIQIEPGGNIGQIAVRLGAEITSTISKSGAYSATIYLHSDNTEVQPVASGPLLVLPHGADSTEASNYAP